MVHKIFTYTNAIECNLPHPVLFKKKLFNIVLPSKLRFFNRFLSFRATNQPIYFSAIECNLPHPVLFKRNTLIFSYHLSLDFITDFFLSGLPTNAPILVQLNAIYPIQSYFKKCFNIFLPSKLRFFN